MAADPARLFPRHSTRAATFENPSAAPGAGGSAGDGRKGAANRVIEPSERVRLIDVSGPGRVSHLWATFAATTAATSPAVARAQLLEVFYDGAAQPSISVPAPDFFGAVHGMRVPYASALTAVNEGQGYSSRMAMPFSAHVAVDWENRAEVPVILYYQADLLMGPLEPDTGFLHAAFRRENPTTLGRDFTVADDLRGPGRFLGWTGGVRVLDPTHWWGEGEVKMYMDGDSGLPTVCGTGTEDYLDSAWGLGTFAAPESGATVWARDGVDDEQHALVSFYRWHLSDPVVFRDTLRVTIQQIGSAIDASSFRLYERSDDWCATAFTYCAQPQPVARCDLDLARRDLPAGRKGLRVVRRPT